MRKTISSVAIIAGVLLTAQAQAASIEERLEAVEKKLENTEGGNFIKSAKDKIDVKLYGQVNKAIMLSDDGENDDVHFVDNDASSTRIGIKAKSKSWNNLSAGAKVELEYQTNDSNKVSMQAPTNGSDKLSKRKLEVWLKHKHAGKLTIGQGSTSTDGIAEMDLSGTTLAGYSHIKISGAGFEFWDNNANANLGDYAGVDVGDTFDHLDGGRMDRVRYDSPEIVGLTLSATGAENNYNDIALTFHKKLEPVEIKAGIGYAYEGADEDPRSRLSGSASVLFNFGLNFTVAAGSAEFEDPTPTTDRDDASFTYFKVGYKFDAFSFGTTAVSFDYGMFDDMDDEEDEGKVYGVQLVQKVKPINTEFYMGFRNFELERDGLAYANVDLEDIQTIMAGARFKF